MTKRPAKPKRAAPASAPSSAQDDLAFMRNLVEQGGKAQMTGGSLFFVGGLLYGVQCLYHWGQMHGFGLPEPWNLTFVAGVTVAFLGYLLWAGLRGQLQTPAGLLGRALGAVFSGVGLANLAMVFVFGLNAGREQSGLVWMLYPPVIFALQGAAWIAAFQIQKHGWQATVGLGWLASACALGWFLRDTEAYILIAAASLFLLMALPGWRMMRHARAEP
jgi:hypothetical protein